LRATATAAAAIVVFVAHESSLLVALTVATLESPAATAIVVFLVARAARFLPTFARGLRVPARITEPSASLSTAPATRSTIVVVIVPAFAAAAAAELLVAIATTIFASLPAALDIASTVVAASVHPATTTTAPLVVSLLVTLVAPASSLAALAHSAIVALAETAAAEPVVVAGFAFAHEAAAIVARRLRVAPEFLAIAATTAIVVAPLSIVPRVAAESSFGVAVASLLTCHCRLLCS
jgi:hypothetical protein